MNEKQQLEQRIALLERHLKRLHYTQQTLDLHLTAIENSITFKIARSLGGPILAARNKLLNLMDGTWLEGISTHFRGSIPDPYLRWVETEASIASPQLTAFPRFAILIPLSDESKCVDRAIASLTRQSYTNWEAFLCPISSDKMNNSAATRSSADPRIHVLPPVGSDGMISAFNQSVEQSTADYLVIQNKPGHFADDALTWLAHAAPADLIYSDEDQVDDAGLRNSPIFRPGWSPDLLLSGMYFGSMFAISRGAWQQVGGFRPEYGDGYDHDLALRITDTGSAVHHVPRVLYHRYPSPRGGESKSITTTDGGRRAVAEALRRRGANAEIEESGQQGTYQIRWRPTLPMRASLILCSRSSRLLERCLHQFRVRTNYPDYEIIVVQHLGYDDAALEAVIEKYAAQRIPYSGVFNFSKMSNLGASAASGDVLIFLNDDTEPLEESWLSRLVAQAERPDVGIAGACLLYPAGTIQHAGIAIGINDGCGHIGRGTVIRPAWPSRWPWLQLTRDVAAVTGACLAIRNQLFQEMGGFATKFPVNYNDTDLCLRVRTAGYRVVYDATVVLRHHECQTRGMGVVTLQERELWFDCWGDVMEDGDPFYNPNLTREREDLSLRDPLK